MKKRKNKSKIKEIKEKSRKNGIKIQRICEKIDKLEQNEYT